MNTKCIRFVAGLALYSLAIITAFAQSGLEFLNCPPSPVSLCVNDPGVRLPANNQTFIGDLNPNASSCNVHVSQSIIVKSNCGKQLQYEVRLFLFDTSAPFVLKPLTNIETDSSSEATLAFDTELSPEVNFKEDGIPYTSGCFPYHRIKWIVIDSCGYESTCDWLVDLQDCSTPKVQWRSNPIIIYNFLSGLFQFDAKSFFSSFEDDCSGRLDLAFSFSKDQFQPEIIGDCCTFLPNGIGLWNVPLKVWIGDKGRDLNCDGKIDWEERRKDSVIVLVSYYDIAGNCDCWEEHRIEGKIQTNYLQPVSLVSVNLNSPGHVFPTFITTQNGEYNFNHITTFPIDVEISADRDDNHKNGVTTLDLVRIQKHLLGIEPFTNPFNLIAADVDNNQRVSAFDIIELRRLILGIYNKLPLNKSWRFVPNDFVFVDTMYPWPFDETIKLTVDTDVVDQDFIAIKVGDVNNTVKPNAQALVTRATYPLVALTFSPKQYEINEIINIDFSINDLKSLSGFQFTLSDPDLEFLSASSNLLDLSEEDYVLFGDKMTMSWFDLDDVAIHPDDIVLTIKAIARHKGSLQQRLQINSDITDAELYGPGEEIFTPKLLLNSDSEAQLIVFPVEPNPWSNDCHIPFRLTTASNILLTIYSMDGNQILSKEKFYSPGYHEFNLNVMDISSTGLLYFTLQSDATRESGKMILMK